MIRIKELRKTHRMTQTALAQKLGITQATLSGWETEKFEIDKNSLIELSNIFNTTTDYILGVTDFSEDINKRLCVEFENVEFNKPSLLHGERIVPTIPSGVLSKIKEGTYRFTHESLEQICENTGLNKNIVLDSACSPISVDKPLSDIDFALYGETKDLSEEDKQDVLDYIQYKKAQKQKRKDNVYLAAFGGAVHGPEENKTPETAREIFQEMRNEEN